MQPRSCSLGVPWALLEQGGRCPGAGPRGIALQAPQAQGLGRALSLYVVTDLPEVFPLKILVILEI